jgi:pimeloyl-ACP methyl ester carboxylesterase
VSANRISLLAMTTSYLLHGQGRVGYDVRGEGPLVVCVPGMGDLRRLYRFMVPELVDAGYRVATMDLRGHGDSDDNFTAFDDVAAAEDLLALIDHLGGPALIVSNSMTGGSSVIAAATDGSKIAGLAMIDPFVRNPKGGALIKLVMRAALLRPWGPAVWRMYYRSLYKTRPPADFTEHQRLMKASMGRADHWRSFARTSRTSHAPAEARLSDVDTPVLVVMGDKDPDFSDPAAEARFAADALHGEVLMIPGAGHYPLVEYPEIVNPAVVDFANRVYSVA